MRTKEENPVTKNKLLKAAEGLMLRRGFEATSLDGICRKAKVTKGCFFHYFKNKEELGKELLKRFCECSQAKIKECVSGGRVKDPLKRVFAQIDFVVSCSSEHDHQGCLLGAFTKEFSDTNPAMRSLCLEGFEEWVKVIQKDLDEAKDKYIKRSSLNTKDLAEYFISIVEGSEILGKAKQDKRVMEKNLEHFKRYVQVLFKG